MTDVDQREISFRVDAHPIDRALIVAQPNFEGAMKLALSFGKFENDKDAARKLGIDGALFSRRAHGGAPWQVNDMRAVIERCQNLIPLVWLAAQYGHGLVMLETEAERQMRDLREQLEAERFKNRTLVDALRGR